MIPWPNYGPHEMLVAPARPSAALWRLVIGILMVTALYLGATQGFFSLVYTLAGEGAAGLYKDLSAGTTPLAMLLLLFSFVFLMVAVAVTVRLIHRRHFRSLLGPLPLLWTDFRRVSVVMVILLAVIAVLPPWDMGGPLVSNMAIGFWALLLPLSLAAVLVQVSAEEIVFRGYIQQQLAARFRSPLVWMILPSALFALGHYLPQAAGENALTIALWAGLFGVLMADLTARSGSLGPAVAVHLWNNAVAMLVVGLPDNLGGLALFHAPFTMQDTAAMAAWLPVDFAMMIVSWLAARLAIRR